MPRFAPLALVAVLAALVSLEPAAAFVPPSARTASSTSSLSSRSFVPTRGPRRTAGGPLFMSSETALPEISSMRVGEMKKELQSYGISTVSFLEKSEVVEALEKARAEGKKPIGGASASPSSSSSASSSSSSSSASSSSTASSSANSGLSRDERIAKEMESLQSMKAGELRKELQEMGVSTKSFFEKSEFVRALAEARVDGVKKASSGGGGGATDAEGYAEYKAADVEVLTTDDAGPRKKGAGQQQQQPGGGG
eukprot:CAMPEP_0183306970 /NCGR_PEP_ID=MMETSP0160_2-20130417/15326_1 /TAXON_ID=2839 ORGANISM="Odontella Sinensis, Strain Grunow 1884" /NCGR_SAMPLE_ID=MMETSP0160_2 /ASSEMBLY_ACC=CAM_ASM_000250 /LENGTH=252 /DNA_ID=CAMNT_0025470457 /DNA_START=183 /DNA_END=937 /DNA_ORIENTATION=-